MDKQPEEVREIIVEKKSGFTYPEMIIIMVIALLFGFLIGNIISFSKQANYSTSGEVKQLVDTYYEIVDNYYEDIDKEELVNAGIKGMIDSLDDPYATYLEKNSSNAFNESLEGTYQGIGVEVMQTTDGQIIITQVFENSPADIAGLKVNDLIVKVNEEDVKGIDLSEVVKKIKGDNTGTVDITVIREEEQIKVTVSRDTVDLPLVSSKVYTVNGKNIGYIKIDIFSANITKQFKNAMSKLKKENIDRLVIDVRDNPGGYLTQVSEILSLFMTKKQVIYQLDTKGVKEKVYGTSKKSTYNYPVVVLINEESASASEILAGAFKETYGAEIIGVNSYGKGTVQRAEGLTGGSTIKYTVQKWLTPQGNWINETGIEPTYKIQIQLEEGQELTEETDNQLQKALEVISQK